MAKFKYDPPDEFTSLLTQLARTSQKSLERCVSEGGKVLEKKVRSNLSAVLSQDAKHGELINSLGVTPAKRNRDGVINVRVGFNEPRRDQGGSVMTRSGKKRSYYVRTNAMIANVLEYGTHDGRQPPRPFWGPAERAVGDKVLEKMQEVFDEEVEKL